jgi:hypothetical protein
MNPEQPQRIRIVVHNRDAPRNTSPEGSVDSALSQGKKPKGRPPKLKDLKAPPLDPDGPFDPIGETKIDVFGNLQGGTSLTA